MKYYGVGLGRTATKSLCKAFEIMGFNSRHYMRSLNLKHIAEYDFMNDMPVSNCFEKLDETFPNSKFIYTIRDMEPWLKSFDIHLELKNRKFVRKHQKNPRIELYGTYEFDEKLFRKAYKKYDDRVKNYFKDRPNDLLIMDICNGDGWNKLIPFVGENVKNKNFKYEGVPFPRIR